MSPVSVAFCVTSKSGLGHLARVHYIARAMRASGPCGQFHLLTNSTPPADLFRNRHAENNPFNNVVIIEKSRFASTLAAIKPQVVVADTVIIPDVGQLAMPIVLVLRETRDEMLSCFAPAPKQGWDLVIVPNPKGHWTPDSRLLPAQFIQHVGWIYDDSVASNTLPRKATSQRKVLLCAGGGGNADWQQWQPYLRQWLERVSATLSQSVQVTQLLGPRARPNTRFDWVHQVIGSTSGLDILMEQFDLVITACGYNSVLELARCTTPGLLVPLQRTFDDQHKRAEQWADSLGFLFDPSNITEAVAWSTELLHQRHRRCRNDLGASGANAASTLVRQIASNSLVSLC